MQALEDHTQIEAIALEEIRNHLARSAPPGTWASISASTPLLDSGTLDSLGILQLMTALSESLGVEIGDEDFVPANFETAGSLARLIASKRRP